MCKNNLINVTIKSHVPPSADIQDFRLGKPFQASLEAYTTLEALLQQLFFNNLRDLGFIAVNGKLAEKERSLADGDLVNIYGLILGG